MTFSRSNPVTGKASSRSLLFTLAAAASLLAMERAAADCIVTNRPGASVEALESGDRVTCSAGAAEFDGVKSQTNAPDIQVTIEEGATFGTADPVVSINSNSWITNHASFSRPTGSTNFFVDGSNSAVTNNGNLSLGGNNAVIVRVFSGNKNTVTNNGALTVTGDEAAGVHVQDGTGHRVVNNGTITVSRFNSIAVHVGDQFSTTSINDATIINNGTISAVTPGTDEAAYGIVIDSARGDSTLTINNGTIVSNNGAAISTLLGNDRVENYGTLRQTSGLRAVGLDEGNDTFVIGGRSSVIGYVDGGADTDTLAFGVDSGSLDLSEVRATTGTYRRFERLEKIGTAEWTLTGTGTGALPIAVTAGRLNLDAVSAGSAVSVADGATLAGTGTAGALTVNSGATLAPGGRSALGTFTATSATFAEGSTFRVRVNDQGANDRLQVNGTATLNGGRVFVDVSGGNLFNKPYTILTANSLAGPRFQSATASLALLQPVLSYDATNVYVTFARVTQEPDQPDEPDDPNDPPVITLDQVGRTWNQISTGRALESQGMTGPLLPVVLAQPTIPDVLRALDLLSGEAYATAVGLASGDTETIHRALLNRLRSVGPTGLPAAIPAPLAYAPTISKAPLPAAPSTPAMLVDLWGQGFGAWGQRDGREGLGVASIDRTTGGFILGAETSFDTAWRIGMAGAYTQTSFELSERLSSGSIDSYHAALYGSGTVGGFALRGGVTYTRHELDVDRAAVLTGFSGDANGSLSLDSAGLFAEIGYPLQFGRMTVEPVASLSYVHTGSGSFSEDGNAMALRGRTNAFDTTWTTLGARLSGDVTEDGRLKANAMLGWRHAFGDRLPTTVNQFIAGSDPFLIIGSPIDLDSLVVEAGLDWVVTPAVTLGVRYDGQYGANDSTQSLRGQFTARF